MCSSDLTIIAGTLWKNATQMPAMIVRLTRRCAGGALRDTAPEGPAGSGSGSAELPPLPHKGRSMRGHDRYWSGTLGQDSAQDKQFSGPYAARPRSRHRKVARKRWKPKVSSI